MIRLDSNLNKGCIAIKFTLLAIAVWAIVNCTPTSDLEYNFNDKQDDVNNYVKLISTYEITYNAVLKSKPDWQNSTFYVGLIEFYSASNDKKSLESVLTWAKNNKWKIGNRPNHADDQLAAYVYLSLYGYYRNRYMIEDIKSKMQSQMSDTSFVWWWSDALFMAPPAFTYARSLKQLNTEEYTYLEWKRAYDLLYDQIDSLFYRDRKFNNHIDKNGDKQFWLRGNGWVVAGLALQLSKMQPTDKYYDFYISVFQEMTKKLAHLYQAENMWSMDLLNPRKYPQIETSGSALICYAFTKGINDGILLPHIYDPIIHDCYNSIIKSITESGKLVNVQPPNAKPEAFDPNNSEPYGSGAVLLFLSAYFEYLSLFG